VGRAAARLHFLTAATAGIPILRGRTFRDRDGMGFDDKHLHQSAVIISESMAREFFPNQDPSASASITATKSPRASKSSGSAVTWSFLYTTAPADHIPAHI
jgi:hypothetical protein